MKKSIIKIVIAIVICVVGIVGLVACGGEKDIVVISRESGSGTRGAFEELLGITEADVKASKISNSTNEVITEVSQNKWAIGYISLGSLNDSVKALKIEGVEATAENILSNEYKLARPFNMVTQKAGTLSPLATEFLLFINSSEAQSVISSNGYVVTVSQPSVYVPKARDSFSGSLKVSGSTSVEPVFQKLFDQFATNYDGIQLQLTANGSSSGIKEAANGTSEIGLASREIKEAELATVDNIVLCKDGIAVIVNKNNALDNLTIENLAKVYKKEISKFSAIS